LKPKGLSSIRKAALGRSRIEKWSGYVKQRI